MTEQIEKHTQIYERQSIIWEGIGIEVRYCADWLQSTDMELVHVEYESKDRCRLPITLTGYRSHFTSRDDVACLNDAVALVKAQLKEASRSPEWQRHCDNQRPGRLF